jgi:hypothetical protein
MMRGYGVFQVRQSGKENELSPPVGTFIKPGACQMRANAWNGRFTPSLNFKAVIATLKRTKRGSVATYEYLCSTCTHCGEHVVARQDSGTYVITRLKAPGCLPAYHFKQLKRS